jgi:hypothetical protein
MLWINLLSIVINLRQRRTSSKKEEDRATTASISRTHLQCQRWGQIPRFRLGRKGLSSFLEKLPILNLEKMIRRKIGGAYRDRTDDLMLAKQPLSQLS